jgi:hypothetical protein
MADAITQISLRVWLLGLLWTVAGALLPSGSAIVFWWAGMASKPDWPTLRTHAISTGLLMAGAYWRKHKALLTLPPVLQQAKELAQEAHQ